MVEDNYIDSIRDKDKDKGYGHKHDKGGWKHMYHMYDHPMMSPMTSPMMMNPMMACPMMQMGCPFMQGMMNPMTMQYPMMSQYPMMQGPMMQYPAAQYPMTQGAGMAQAPMGGYSGQGMTGYPSSYPYGYQQMGTKREESAEE